MLIFMLENRLKKTIGLCSFMLRTLVHIYCYFAVCSFSYFLRLRLWPGSVDHAYNPSYTRDISRRILVPGKKGDPI
jgi:hypothetical protein